MINIILQALAYVVPLSLVYLNFKWHSFWRVRNVPGPTPWPIFGTTIYYLLRPKVDVDLEWAEKYGNVYGIFEGYEPHLKVNDSQLIDYVMVKNHKQFVDRPMRGVNSKGMKSWLFFSEGDQWINKRLLVTPMFTSAKLNFYSNVMTECIETFFEQIESSTAKDLKHTDSVKQAAPSDMKQIDRGHFMALALDIMCRVLHSCKINTYQGSESEFHRRAFAFSSFDVGYWIFFTLMPRKLCQYLQLDITPASKFEYLNKLGLKFINQRRKELEAGKKAPADIIQMMLDAKIPEKNDDLVYETADDIDSHFNNNLHHDALEKIHKDQMDGTKIYFRQFDDIERCNQMTFFFIAGFDTTSASLTFIFHALAKYQAEQDEIYKQIMEYKKSIEQDNNKANILTWQDVTKLEKLDCFISETLRIYPPVTILNRVVATEEGLLLPTKSGTIQLPYKTPIVCDPFVVHRDPANWDEPLKFKMSRFSNENKPKIVRGSYVPFGIGPRNCAGYRFASLNLKQVIANVLARYQIMPMPVDPMSSKKPLDLAPEDGSQYTKHPFFLQFNQNCFVLVPRN